MPRPLPIWRPLRLCLLVGALAAGCAQGPTTRPEPKVSTALPQLEFTARLEEPGGATLALTGVATAPRLAAQTPLAVYRLHPHPQGHPPAPTKLFELSDPQGHLRFPIVHHFSPGRPLTAADLELRAFAPGADGGFWFLDALGPLLLETDAAGRVLGPPHPLRSAAGEALRSPLHPGAEEGALLRAVNALFGHALRHGAPIPLVTPDHGLLDDGDLGTHLGHRRRPPGALAPASSELVNLGAFGRAGYQVVPWTVNDEARMRALIRLGVDGIITDHPQLLNRVLREERPSALLEDGRVDRNSFDLQAHRGARTVRPENTLPSFELALDALATTLETDVGLTADHVPFISHDAVMEAQKCRRLDGAEYRAGQELLLTATFHRVLQSELVCDKLLSGWGEQRNDPELSPVSQAFAKAQGLPHPYSPLTLGQLLDLPAFYANWYRLGPGASHPEAQLRAQNAERVHFNLEPKADPRPSSRQPEAGALAEATVAEVVRRGLWERTIIQSFNWQVLLRVHQRDARIRTGCLIGDSLNGGNLATGEDGTGAWLAGLPYPWRVTALSHPPNLPSRPALALEVEAGGAALLVTVEGHPPLRFDLSAKSF